MIRIQNIRRYCYEPELIENYDKAMADTSQVWHCHHRTETIMNCGKKELIQKGCYYHRPAHELIFLTNAEHLRLHTLGKKMPPRTMEYRRRLSEAHMGKHLSTEHKRKLSDAHKGVPHHWLRGKPSPMRGRKHTVESRKKMSEARGGDRHHNYGKHLSSETRRKIGLANSRPKRTDIWENVESIFRLKSEGWTQKRIAEHFRCSECLVSNIIHGKCGRNHCVQHTTS